MTSILLMLLLSVFRPHCVFPVPSCPASCVVCSENAVICHRLGHIIDAPDTTQALLLTEGSISTVQSASLSDLSNITVIGLSHNRISELGEESFRNMPSLHTLQLDHNLLTSRALQGGALTNLTQLEVLALGHNLIDMIQAGWLTGTTALRSLKLEGNLLTSLDSGSFPLYDLKDLENLDLSDNVINSLDRNTFRGLVGLRSLDLSRNRLSSAPLEPFSYLNWLTNLNLDLNSWNCSCHLLELATFLSNFIQQPDKTLYNGRRMVCVSADNPSVTTVLELTEANCVPSNQNITVQIGTRNSVTPQLYARDLAITAVICFIGGVSLTMLVVLICYQVSRKKKLTEGRRQREKEEGIGTVVKTEVNYPVNHLDVEEKRRDLFFQARQPWDSEAMTADARIDSHDSPFRSRAENDICFRCSDCSSEGPRVNTMKWDNRMRGGMEAEEDRERRRVRMMMEEERRKPGNQQDILGRDIPNRFVSLGNSNSSSHPLRERFIHRPETLAAYKANSETGESYRADLEVKNRGYETSRCESCHRTYRPSEQNMRQGRVHTNLRDSAPSHVFPPQHRLSDRGRTIDCNQFDLKNKHSRRETRNVTFNLESSKTWKEERNSNKGKDWTDEAVRTSRDRKRGIERKQEAKVQSHRSSKVKPNMNPLRKSKIHPKRKAEQGNLDKISSKKSKDKRLEEKERAETDDTGSSGKNTMGSSKKAHKSTKNKGVIESDEKEEEEEDGGESSKQKQTPSTNRLSDQVSAEVDQGENTHRTTSQHTPIETDSAADQSHTASAEGASVSSQGQASQGLSSPYDGAGLGLVGPQLASEQSFSLSATDRHCTTSSSMVGSTGSQLTGSNLSLQRGNVVLNTMAPVAIAQLPCGPAQAIAPIIAISGSNIAQSGAPDSFSRQAVSLTSPANSLLANARHANPSQACVTQTAPSHRSGAEGLALNLTANTAINSLSTRSDSQSQLPLDSSPLEARLNLDPAPGSGLQTGDELHSLFSEYQAPQSIVLPPQAPGPSGPTRVNPQFPSPVTTVENLSNNNSQTENGCVPGGLTVDMSAGGISGTEGEAVGMSEGSMPVADVSLSGGFAQGGSTQNLSSTGSTAAAAALLQQEYLSEEGGSSPRRKLRLVLPEKTTSREPTALERKIR